MNGLSLIIGIGVLIVVGGVITGIYYIINNAYRGGGYDKSRREQLRIAEEINSLVTKYDRSVKTYYNATKNSYHEIMQASVPKYLYNNIDEWNNDSFERWLFGYSKLNKEEYNPVKSKVNWSKEDIAKFNELKNAYIQHSEMASKHIKKYVGGNNATLNQAMAKSGTPFATQAKEQLAAAQAKKDRNEVIKGGVVGGVIGGVPGAVIGAAAKQTEVNSRNNANK